MLQCWHMKRGMMCNWLNIIQPVFCIHYHNNDFTSSAIIPYFCLIASYPALLHYYNTLFTLLYNYNTLFTFLYYHNTLLTLSYYYNTLLYFLCTITILCLLSYIIIIHCLLSYIITIHCSLSYTVEIRAAFVYRSKRSKRCVCLISLTLTMELMPWHYIICQVITYHWRLCEEFAILNNTKNKGHQSQ